MGTYNPFPDEPLPAMPGAAPADVGGEPEVPGRSNVAYPGYNPFPVDTWTDVKRSFASGLNTGVHAPVGQFGDYRDMMKQFGDWVYKKAGGSLEQKAKAEEERKKNAILPEVTDYLPSTQSLKNLDKTNIYDWKSQTWPGAVTQAFASGVPGVVLGAPSSLPRAVADLVRFGLAPAVTSTVAQKAMHEFNPEYEDVAAMVGSRWGQKKATQFITPNPITHMGEDSRRAYEGQKAQVRAEGIPVSAGASADSRGLRYAESEVNPAIYNKVLEANTRAATRRISNGEGGTHETSIFERDPARGVNTLDSILNNVGSRFDQVTGRNVMHVDPFLGQDMTASQNHFTRTPGAYGDAAISAMNKAQNHVRELLQTNGKHPDTKLNFLTAEQYQKLRSDYSRGARSATDPQVGEALHDFVHTLDEAMQRSLNRPPTGTPGVPHYEAGGNPADAAVFPQLRRDYRNALVVEDAVKASNLAGARGHITPAALESSAAKVMGRRAHERGYDEFSYAPAAKSVLFGMPDSGTSPREQFHKTIENMINIPVGAAGWLAGAVGAPALGLPHGEAGALGGMLGAQHILGPMAAKRAESAIASYLGTKTGQAHLGNQLLTEAPGPGMGSLPGLLSTTEAIRRPKKSHDLEGLLSGPPEEEKLPMLRSRGGRNLNLVE